MSDHTIHSFVYFLTELEKNLRIMERCFEQERISLGAIHILCSTMQQMCKNSEMKERFYLQEQD